MLYLIFFFVLDESNTIASLCVMKYYFTGEEHDLPKVPHGNSKGGTPYKRTRPSTMKRLKEVCRTHLPSQACSVVENENGGIIDADSSGSIPRRRQQANDIRRKLFANEDELAAVVQQCKLEDGKETFVSVAPEPLLVNFRLKSYKGVVSSIRFSPLIQPLI